MGNSDRKWVYLLLVLILRVWCSDCEGCWEQERLALFQLRHHFNSPYFLYDWVEGDENSDCCQWEYVECSNTTGRVITLLLSFFRLGEVGELYLNVSLFTPFQELEVLALEENNIAGCLENEGFERLSKLSNLKSLFLGHNLFNNSILYSLNGLSSLRELELSGFGLNETNAAKGLQMLSKLKNLQILYLSDNSLNNNILSSLNALSSLRELYLGFNNLKGTIDIEELDSLSNLEVLDVSYNSINRLLVPTDHRGLRKLNTLQLEGVATINGKTLLQSIESFPSLKILDLSSNNFTETMVTDTQELQNFANLEELILDNSDFHISLIQSVATFPSLKRLSMCSCKIHGNLRGQGLPKFINNTELDNDIFQIIKSMPSLKVLSLSNCSLKSMILDQGLCELVHLQELYLNENGLMGALPWCLANMTSLQVLDVSDNQLTGNISFSPLQYLTSLQVLDVSYNHFHIPLSLRPFYNLSNLKSFSARYSKIYADAESHSLLAPKFQLNSLILFTPLSDSGTFPKFLYHQHDLQYVDLFHIKLGGEFPNWLLENNSKLETLSLVNLSLSGPFRMPIHSHLNLVHLDISNNFLHAHIPTEIGAYFPRLSTLDISDNAFNGSIPSSFGDMKLLSHLDLSNNQLIGGIPEHLTMGCFSLQYLALSNNSLQGRILSKSFNLRQLIWLRLDGNHFIGEIFQSLSNCSELFELYLRDNHFEGPIPVEFCQLLKLEILDLSNNRISGNLPSCLSGFPFLSYFILANNNLEGEMPIEICQLKQLQLIDLSHNNLSGQIPPCLVITRNEDYGDTIALMDFRGDETIKFTTKKISYFYMGKPLESMSGIDFSCNQLVGEIPRQIGYLIGIHTLNLSHNNFLGTIPISFSNLKQIESLDLSYNNLSGKIPSQLVKLNFLAVFSVAHNNLSGRTPERIAQFITFTENSYEGNPLLCGLPLPKSCSDIGSSSLMPNGSTNSEEMVNGLIDMDTFYITFIVSYTIVLLGIIGVLYINPYWRQRWFYLVELWMTSCYYFIADHLSTIFCH